MNTIHVFSVFFAISSTTSGLDILEHQPVQDYNKSHDEIEQPILRSYHSDILYHFYSQSSPNNGFKVRTSTVELLRYSGFDASKETLFIIHGWKNSNESAVNYHIRQKILKHHDINVFVVDWSVVAGKSYWTAQRSVVKVGEYVADFIKDLKYLYGLQLRKVKFVGHSLGAHICGNAGSFLNGAVDRITGLDPAGPLFKDKNIHNRLDPTDAKFVQIIHTNDGLLGYRGVLGDADYYPNGGASQPGCGFDMVGSCAHSRAFAYYAESLNNKRLFIAKRCTNYSDYTRGRCNFAPTSLMGRFNIDYRSKGTYYLKTNKASPYSRG